MRISQIAAVAAVGIALAGSALALAQSTTSKDKVSGLAATKTLPVHPISQTPPNPENTSPYAFYYGAITVNITTTISADTAKILPTGYAILCDLRSFCLTSGAAPQFALFEKLRIIHWFPGTQRLPSPKDHRCH